MEILYHWFQIFYCVLVYSPTVLPMETCYRQ